MPSHSKADLARQTWRHLFDFFTSTRSQRDRALSRLGLTPNDARALSSLSTETGIPMRVLADGWGTDASNATSIVDRLERQGLARRTGVPHDRRIKLVVLTAKGGRTKSRLAEALYEPPAELLALGADELTALRDALQKVVGPSRP